MGWSRMGYRGRRSLEHGVLLQDPLFGKEETSDVRVIRHVLLKETELHNLTTNNPKRVLTKVFFFVLYFFLT